MMATAGRLNTVAEVEHLAEPGEIDGDHIIPPGIYVHRIDFHLPNAPPSASSNARPASGRGLNTSEADPNGLDPRPNGGARRQGLKDGFYVNLGIGIPTLVANYIPEGVDVQLQSENGMLGMGPFPFEGQEDPDLMLSQQADRHSIADDELNSSADSFAMIRGGHIDLAILGAAMQIAENGDLASWMIPGKMVKGMGGAMDLGVAGVKRIVVVDGAFSQGRAKLLHHCTLPLTGDKVVDLDNTGLTACLRSTSMGSKRHGSRRTRAQRDQRRNRRQDRGDLPGGC